MTDTDAERAEITRKYEAGELRDTVTEEDLQWWFDIAPTLEWRWATTMAKFAPHWYIQRERTKLMTLEEYYIALRVIWTFGEPEKFHKRTNIRLVSPDGKYKWFTSDGPLENALINCAEADAAYGLQDAPSTHTDDFTIYDSLSMGYDDRYENAECHRENSMAWKTVMMPTVGEGPHDLLDIGCGTGLALDLRMVKEDPELYFGVDPSQGMLNRLVWKHRWVKNIYPVTLETFLEDELNGMPRDKVVSLFGSPSYATPEAIRALPQLARRELVLMHYREGYLPSYHTEETAPPYAEESRKAALSLLDDHRGRTFSLGNFQVVVLLKEPFQWE